MSEVSKSRSRGRKLGSKNIRLSKIIKMTCAQCSKKCNRRKPPIAGAGVLCKSCQQKIRMAKNPAYKKKHREWKLQHNYGISTATYEKILERQGSVCAICKVRRKENEPSLAVDHDHNTGKIRGILCQKCNRAIGALSDSTENLSRAIAYLRRHDPKRSWDEYFMQIAELVATRSKDPSTQVGAVLVREKYIISTGYNGLPRGVNDDVPERYDRPQKYLWMCHAEENAIYQCGLNGIKTAGAAIYVTPLFPCARCAHAIAQSGVREVVTTDAKRDNPRWADEFELSMAIFQACKIIVRKPE